MANIRRLNIIIGETAEGTVTPIYVGESGSAAEAQLEKASASGEFVRAAYFRAPSPHLVKERSTGAAPVNRAATAKPTVASAPPPAHEEPTKKAKKK
jgi:hypothetical protein